MLLFEYHSQLENDLIPMIQRAIDRISNAHLFSPQKDEIFDIFDNIIIRLQNYIFNQNFAVVTGIYSQGRKNYTCIHYSNKINNNKKFLEHKQKTKPLIEQQKYFEYIFIFRFTNHKRIFIVFRSGQTYSDWSSNKKEKDLKINQKSITVTTTSSRFYIERDSGNICNKKNEV